MCQFRVFSLEINVQTELREEPQWLVFHFVCLCMYVCMYVCGEQEKEGLAFVYQPRGNDNGVLDLVLSITFFLKQMMYSNRNKERIKLQPEAIQHGKGKTISQKPAYGLSES